MHIQRQGFWMAFPAVESWGPEHPLQPSLLWVRVTDTFYMKFQFLQTSKPILLVKGFLHLQSQPTGQWRLELVFHMKTWIRCAWWAPDSWILSKKSFPLPSLPFLPFPFFQPQPHDAGTVLMTGLLPVGDVQRAPVLCGNSSTTLNPAYLLRVLTFYFILRSPLSRMGKRNTKSFWPDLLLWRDKLSEARKPDFTWIPSATPQSTKGNLGACAC